MAPPPPPSPHHPPHHHHPRAPSSSATAQTLSPHATHHHFHHRLPVHRSPSASRRSCGPSTPFPHLKHLEQSIHHSLAASSPHRAVSAPPRRLARSTPSAGKLAVSLWEHHEASASPQPHHGINSLHQSSYSAEASPFESCSFWQEYKESAGDTTAVRPISRRSEKVNRSAKRIQHLKGPLVLSNKLQFADPGNRASPTYILKVVSHRRGQAKTNMSVVAALRVQPEHAQRHVQKHGISHELASKEYDNLINGFFEENNFVQGKQKGKVKAVVLSMREELEQEHKAKKRLEIHNRKLSKNLSRTSKALRKAMAELQKERHSRELMEGRCSELVKEIEEDKVQVEGLRNLLVGVREEVEEERKMLHLADMWREERLQMKLEDARLELEEEQHVVESLRSELELLKCRGNFEVEGDDPGDLGCDGPVELGEVRMMQHPGDLGGDGPLELGEVNMMQDATSFVYSPNNQFNYELSEQPDFAMD